MHKNSPWRLSRMLPTEYWVLALAWLFWVISQGLLRIESNETLSEAFILGVALVHGIVLFTANLLFIKSFEKIKSNVKSKAPFYLLSVWVLILFSLAAVFFNVTFYNWTHDREIFRPLPRYLTNGLEKTTFIAGFSTMFFLIRNLKDYQKQTSILEEAQQTARDAQLQLLQQQLNPHFLFNSLNSLRSLIAIDKDRAREMVTDLSEFLRVTLSSYKSVSNTLQDEVRLLEYYLKIQKIRFEEELEYTVHIQQDIQAFTIPKFILQPLVENAVKYGMLTSPMPLRLSVLATQQKDEIKLVVENTGKLAHSNVETHNNNGLFNAQARINLMFGGRNSFSLTESKGVVKAEITIKNPVPDETCSDSR